MHVVCSAGYRRHSELREVFKSFASFGAGHGVNRKEASKLMDGFRFAKLCKVSTNCCEP